jgi:hypothetical protein
MVPLAVVLCLVLVGSSVAQSKTSVGPGVYRGAVNPRGVAQFEHWLGTRVATVEDFLDASSWATIVTAKHIVRWDAGPKRPPRYRMVYGVPIVPYSGGSLAEGAAGDYDGYFRELAHTLLRVRQPNAILRLGWEFSGGWYPWTVHSDEEAGQFAAYWRRIVTIMRKVAPQLQFDWNPAIGWAPFDPANAYPGNAYVDYIGVDVYDQSWIQDYQDPAARWNDYLHGQWSLNWYVQFARAHDKPLSVPEWGLVNREDGHGGGDDPLFVQNMHDWMQQHHVAYEVYFEFNAPDGDHALMDGQFPQSADIYRQLFGSGSGT